MAITRRYLLSMAGQGILLWTLARATKGAAPSDSMPHPEGSEILIAVEESNSSVAFLDASSRRVLRRIAVGHWPHEIEVSRDGRTAYISNFGLKDYDEHIGSPGDSISVVDLTSFVEKDRLYLFTGPQDWGKYRAPHGLKLSPDGSRLYVNAEVGDAMLVYELARSASTGTAAPTVFSLPQKAHNFIFSRDGRSLFVACGANGLRKLDSQSGKESAQLRREGAIRGVDYTTDGANLIVSGSNEICIVRPDDLSLMYSINDLGVRQILYTIPCPDGRHLLAPAVWEGELLVIDVNERRVVERLVVGADPIHLALSADRPTAYLSHGRSLYASEIDLATFKETRRFATLGGPNGIAVSRKRNAPRARRLRIGACIPLSGSNFNEGHDLRLGYQFWEETVNAAGGLLVDDVPHAVEMVFVDSRSETQESVIGPLTEELVRKGCSILFGGYPSPPNEHSGRVADKHQIPLITASGAAERIYQQGLKFIFGIMSSANSFLKGTFEYLLTLHDPPRSALFLSCSDPAAHQDADTTARIVTQEMGLKVLAPDGTKANLQNQVLVFPHLQSADLTAIENLKDIYRSVLSRTTATGIPDVFVHTGHLPEAVALVQVASEMKYTPKGFTFSVGPAMPAFADQLGTLADNMLGSAMWTPSQIEAGHDRFISPDAFSAAFYGRFSKKASYLAAGAMACGVVLEDAIKRAHTLDGPHLRDAFIRTSLPTFYSHVEFDARGLNAKRPLVSIQLQRKAGDLSQVALWPREISGQASAIWPFPGWPSTT